MYFASSRLYEGEKDANGFSVQRKSKNDHAIPEKVRIFLSIRKIWQKNVNALPHNAKSQLSRSKPG